MAKQNLFQKLLLRAAGAQVSSYTQSIALRAGHHMPMNYAALAKEGYIENPVIRACLEHIIQAVCSTPFVIEVNGEQVKEHPILELLNRPHPMATRTDLLTEIVGHLFLGGETFLQGIRVGSRVTEIYAHRPDHVTVVQGTDGFPVSYTVTSDTEMLRSFAFPQLNNEFTDLYHIKFWSPIDHWRGLSRMSAAARSGDEHNALSRLFTALLGNAARPSGALVYDAKVDGNSQRLPDEDYARLKAEMQENYQGANNAGRPLLLDGNLKWVPMSMTMRDMESDEQRGSAAREIALAIGVPPLLLGLKGDNTYSNYGEANVAFWRQTVTPFVLMLCEKLTRWLEPIYPAARIVPDLDASPIAESEKVKKWDRVKSADMLTVDEKRQLLGYEPLGGEAGNAILVPANSVTLSDVTDPLDPVAAGEEAYGEG